MFRPCRYLPKPLRRRARDLARKLIRIGCVLLALAGYAVACFGIPLARPSEKDLSQPFPCAHRSCGCMNAESCWKECCCFTREQKLAWAVANNVSVPASVLNERSRSCCQKVARVAHCETKSKPASCCSKPTEPEKKTTWVLGMQARKCRGQGTDWLSAGAVLPGPPRVTLTIHAPCAGEVFLLEVLSLAIDAVPPTPPPLIQRLS